MSADIADQKVKNIKKKLNWIKWVCPLCTFENNELDGAVLKCKICYYDKPINNNNNNDNDNDNDIDINNDIGIDNDDINNNNDFINDNYIQCPRCTVFVDTHADKCDLCGYKMNNDNDTKMNDSGEDEGTYIYVF